MYKPGEPATQDWKYVPFICPFCQQYHTANCPKVKALEYWPNGTLKRIEYHECKESD